MKHHSHHSPAARPDQQRGVVLVTGLLLLVLVTLVVLASTRSGRLQTIMASNTRDRDIAFQAAEAALLDAEARIATEFHAIFTAPANGSSATPAIGLLNRVMLDDDERYGLIVLGSTTDYWVQPAAANGYGWFKPDGRTDSAKSIAISRAVPVVHEQPRFVIEYLGMAGGNLCGSLWHYRYRITALATGVASEPDKQAGTRVILQTEYRHCAA